MEKAYLKKWVDFQPIPTFDKEPYYKLTMIIVNLFNDFFKIDHKNSTLVYQLKKKHPDKVIKPKRSDLSG